jgi:hypothetical protein
MPTFSPVSLDEDPIRDITQHRSVCRVKDGDFIISKDFETMSWLVICPGCLRRWETLEEVADRYKLTSFLEWRIALKLARVKAKRTKVPDPELRPTVWDRMLSSEDFF